MISIESFFNAHAAICGILLAGALSLAASASGAAAESANSAASGQHELIGVKTTRENFKRTTNPEAQWFGDAGLGLFLHWGISSVHGGIDLSWGMMADKPWDKGEKPGVSLVTPEEYFNLARSFHPDKYDPDKWLRAAKEAGFRYAVLTTRHHDGFALWPSTYGDFGVRQTLPGVDLVDQFVRACRKNGLKVGLYYSPPDWHYNRQYMSFHYGSGDQKRFPGRAHYGLRHEPIAALPEKPADWDAKYLAYIHGQVSELLTHYGKIDLLWFDGGPEAISFDEIRRLQPGIVVNPRMHGYGDFQTPECAMPSTAINGWWELCDIWPNGGWGYSKSHENYKTTGWMLSRLAQVRGWGGNYLINVAPRPTGELPDVYYARLKELRAWMKHSGKALFGAQPGPHPERCNVPCTVKGQTWYLLVPPDFKEPVTVRADAAPHSVFLLRTGEKLAFTFQDGTLRLEIPAAQRTALVDAVQVDW